MTYRILTVAAVAVAVGLVACSESYAVISASAPTKANFTTTLSGASEVPAVTTSATGWANWVLEDPNTL